MEGAARCSSVAIPAALVCTPSRARTCSVYLPPSESTAAPFHILATICQPNASDASGDSPPEVWQQGRASRARASRAWLQQRGCWSCVSGTLFCSRLPPPLLRLQNGSAPRPHGPGLGFFPRVLTFSPSRQTNTFTYLCAPCARRTHAQQPAPARLPVSPFGGLLQCCHCKSCCGFVARQQPALQLSRALLRKSPGQASANAIL